jgi:phage shock protein C
MSENRKPGHDDPRDREGARHGTRNPHGERRFGVEFNVWSGDRASSRPMQSRLYRNPRDGWLRGVCAGLGDYFGVSASWFRWAFALGTLFFFFPTVFIYFGAGFLLAERPEHLYDTPEEERFWRGVRVTPARTYSGLAHRFRSMERRLRSIEALVTSREFRLSREIDKL